MQLLRAGLAAVLLTLGAVSIAAPAQAHGVIDTNSPRCHADFVSLKAIDIQEENQGSDEIQVKMNNTLYPATASRSFVVGQTRPGTDFRSDAHNFDFAGHIHLNLREVDGTLSDLWEEVVIDCPPDPLGGVVPTHHFIINFHASFRYVDYEMRFDVTRFA
jgi:hypothetical protein